MLIRTIGKPENGSISSVSPGYIEEEKTEGVSHNG
jgi:hypothetical protein